MSHRYANIESVAATLPNQTKWKLESLKMKGIIASPVELVDCESFEINTGISTLLKPQHYKGKNIFAFTPEKSIHFVVLLSNTPNQHNQIEPSKPSNPPSFHLMDKHETCLISTLIDELRNWLILCEPCWKIGFQIQLTCFPVFGERIQDSLTITTHQLFFSRGHFWSQSCGDYLDPCWAPPVCEFLRWVYRYPCQN